MITTSRELQKNLGDLFPYIKNYDIHKKERNKTPKFRKILIKKYGENCAICGSESDVEAAHIIPLELGGKTTEDNLILLCKYDHHIPYDAGMLSINSMKEVRKQWAETGGNIVSVDYLKPPEIDILSTITPVPIKIKVLIESVEALKTKNFYSKALRDLKTATKTTKGESLQYIYIKMAEVNRRRNVKGSLVKSDFYISCVDEQTLSPQLKSYYHYERHMIKLYFGKHEEALQSAKASEETSYENYKKGIGGVIPYVAAVSGRLNNEIAMTDNDNFDISYFEQQYKEIEPYVLEAEQYYRGRWIHNICHHHQLISLKAKDHAKSTTNLKEFIDNYYNWDVSNGWASSSLQALSYCIALNRILFAKEEKDIEKGLQLTARAFLARMRGTQFFSGIRDAGFAFAIGLKN